MLGGCKEFADTVKNVAIPGDRAEGEAVLCAPTWKVVQCVLAK